MTRPVFCLLVLLCAAAQAAQPPTPREFAWSFAIATPETRPLQRVELTQEVYRSLARGDLADLRVLNADDEIVEHAFVPPRAPAPAAPAAASLPLFPLRGPQPVGDAGALTIAIDAHGTLIDLRQQPGAGERVTAWVIDAGEEHASIGALTLTWPETARDFVAAVALESSADLRAWQEVGSATLVSLTHGGQRLAKNDIVLARPPARYLRLAWPAATGGAELVAVSATLRRESVETRRWMRVDGAAAAAQKAAGDGVQAFEFDALGWPPADRLRVAFAEPNSMAMLRLRSRATPAEPWRERGSSLFYRLQADGTEIRSADLALDARRDRYWRIETRETLARMPALELGWRPDELVFVARGRAPFRLVAGNAAAQAGRQPVDRLLADLGAAQRERLIGTALLGERTELAGAAALAPLAPPVPWQRYLLWALLLGGVLLLLAMAVRLYRQMNGSP